MVAADTRTQARHRGCPGGGDSEVRDGTAASGFTLLVTTFRNFLSLFTTLFRKKAEGPNVLISHLVPKPAPP